MVQLRGRTDAERRAGKEPSPYVVVTLRIKGRTQRLYVRKSDHRILAPGDLCDITDRLNAADVRRVRLAVSRSVARDAGPQIG